MAPPDGYVMVPVYVFWPALLGSIAVCLVHIVVCLDQWLRENDRGDET